MQHVEDDNRFFTTMFFPAYKAPKKMLNPLPKRFWTRLSHEMPYVALLIQVLGVYLVYRILRRIAQCLMPDLFSGTCWVDMLVNCFGARTQSCCPRNWCPVQDCQY